MLASAVWFIVGCSSSSPSDSPSNSASATSAARARNARNAQSEGVVARPPPSIGAVVEIVVEPKLVFNTPGWDDQLRADLAGQSSSEVSIENSVAVDGDTVYFGNSGGLVQGWDLAPLRTGGMRRGPFATGSATIWTPRWSSTMTERSMSASSSSGATLVAGRWANW